MIFKERLLLAMAVKKPWQRYVLTVLFLLLFIITWWSFCYKALYCELQQRTAAMSTGACSENALQITEPTKTPNASDFFIIPAMSSVVQNIVKISQENNLNITKLHVADAQALAWALRTHINLVLEGEFFALVKFFEALQPASNIIVEQCTMSRARETTLACTCVLSVYTKPPSIQ